MKDARAKMIDLAGAETVKKKIEENLINVARNSKTDQDIHHLRHLIHDARKVHKLSKKCPGITEAKAVLRELEAEWLHRAKVAAVQIQACFRGRRVHREYLKMREAIRAKKLRKDQMGGAWWQAVMQAKMKRFIKRKLGAKLIQAKLRASKSKASEDAKKESVTKMQAQFQSHRERSNFIAKKEAAIKIETHARGMAAKKELEKRKQKVVQEKKERMKRAEKERKEAELRRIEREKRDAIASEKSKERMKAVSSKAAVVAARAAAHSKTVASAAAAVVDEARNEEIRKRERARVKVRERKAAANAAALAARQALSTIPRIYKMTSEMSAAIEKLEAEQEECASVIAISAFVAMRASKASAYFAKKCEKIIAMSGQSERNEQGQEENHMKLPPVEALKNGKKIVCPNCRKRTAAALERCQYCQYVLRRKSPQNSPELLNRKQFAKEEDAHYLHIPEAHEKPQIYDPTGQFSESDRLPPILHTGKTTTAMSSLMKKKRKGGAKKTSGMEFHKLSSK
tara:strand:- start:293 stop:1834 length:1542 start_codon:yes stop_codon:yes gene_type:complete